MYEIVVHESAHEEINAAAVFYESREPDLGEEFLQELSQNFQRIKSRPFSYGIYFDDYRRCLMSRFLSRSFMTFKVRSLPSWLLRICAVDLGTGEIAASLNSSG